MSGLTGMHWHNHNDVAITREYDVTVLWRTPRISNTFFESLMVTNNEIHYKTPQHCTLQCWYYLYSHEN